jgi:hypothetical protein
LVKNSIFSFVSWELNINLEMKSTLGIRVP